MSDDGLVNTSRLRWIEIHSKFNSVMYLEKAGYFDERPQLHTSATQLIALIVLPFLCLISLYWLFLFPLLLFGYGKMFIYLPIKTGIQDCESATWGFAAHNETLWLYIGGGGNFEGGKRWITWNVPFITKEWVRTSILLKDDTWAHETKGSRECFYNDEWKSKQKGWKYDYTDSYDGEIVPTTIYIEQREWRPKWLMWTSLFNMVKTDIDIHFSKEVGSRKGSYKGGVLGCSYGLNKGESAIDCLKRMERERKF